MGFEPTYIGITTRGLRPLDDRHHMETFLIISQCWHKEPFAPARGPNADAFMAYGTRQECLHMANSLRAGLEPARGRLSPLAP